MAVVASKENHDTMESLRSIDLSTLEPAENSIEKSFSLFFFTGITWLTEARLL